MEHRKNYLNAIHIIGQLLLLCWVILAIWVLFERQRYQVRGGWLALLLGVVPGVAVGFALYLLMRQRQLKGSGLV